MFPAGVTQIARQGQFVPAAPCPSTDGCNADERSFRQPQDKIDPNRHRICSGQHRKLAGFGKIEVVEEVVGDAAGEDDNLNCASSLSSLTTSCSRETVSGTIKFTGGFENVILQILGVGRSRLIVLVCVILRSASDVDEFV